MPVRTTCPGCQASFDVPEAFAGKTVRCMWCDATFAVPAPAVPPETSIASGWPTPPVPRAPRRRAAPAPAPRTRRHVVPLAGLAVLAVLGVGFGVTVGLALYRGSLQHVPAPAGNAAPPVADPGK